MSAVPAHVTISGLRNQLARKRRQLGRVVDERDDARDKVRQLQERLDQARREIDALKPLADRWHRIGELIDAYDDDAIGTASAISQIREQVGDR